MGGTVDELKISALRYTPYSVPILRHDPNSATPYALQFVEEEDERKVDARGYKMNLRIRVITFPERYYSVILLRPNVFL